MNEEVRPPTPAEFAKVVFDVLRRGWTQKASARAADRTLCHPISSRACAFCVEGAISRAEFELAIIIAKRFDCLQSHMLDFEAFRESPPDLPMQAAIRAVRQEWANLTGAGCLVAWNDDPQRTQEEVLKMAWEVVGSLQGQCSREVMLDPAGIADEAAGLLRQGWCSEGVFSQGADGTPIRRPRDPDAVAWSCTAAVIEATCRAHVRAASLCAEAERLTRRGIKTNPAIAASSNACRLAISQAFREVVGDVFQPKLGLESPITMSDWNDEICSGGEEAAQLMERIAAAIRSGREGTG